MQQDDSARHSQLAQYSQKSLQASKSFRSSKDEADIEQGTIGSTDAVLDSAAEGQYQGESPARSKGLMGTPNGSTRQLGIPKGREAQMVTLSQNGQTASQKKMRGLRGASDKSMGSSNSSRSLSIHALGAAGLLP